jgi:hypothetical protein
MVFANVAVTKAATLILEANKEKRKKTKEKKTQRCMIRTLLTLALALSASVRET